MGRVWRFGACCTVLVIAACSDEGGASPDGGTGDGGSGIDLPAPPAPPEIPWWDPETEEESLEVAPPALTPCPDGWREVDGECDPWPESGPDTSCGPGAAHFPGEPGCVPVGTPCPPGDFALGLTDAETIFVRAGATGGDGTRASPHGSIADAMAEATPGTTVALAKGSYTEPVEIPEGVSLVGACAAATELSPGSGSAFAAVYTDAASTVVADLAIIDAEHPGLIANGPSASMDVDGVVLGNALAVGIVAGDGATMELDRVVVRGTRPASDGSYGRAIIAQQGSQVTVSHAVLEMHHDVTVASVNPGTKLTLRDAVVRGTTGDDGGIGRGVWAAMEGEVVLERVEVADNYEVGLVVQTGGTASADQVIFRDTETGWGVGVEQGSATVSRAVIARNSHYSVSISDGGEATFEDVVIRDTRPNPADGGLGYGLLVADDAHVELTRAVLSANRAAAMRVVAAPAELVATDVVVRDTVPDSDGAFGRGIEALEGATLTLRHSRVEGNIADAIAVFASELDAEDLVVQDTDPQEGATDGHGVSCLEGSTCTGQRWLLSGSSGAGFLALDSTAVVRDLVIIDTRDHARGNTVSGAGVDAREGARVTLLRVLARRNRVAGVVAVGPDTVIEIGDASVQETQSRESNGTLGLGMIAALGAYVAGERVAVTDNHTAGVYVSESEAELVDLRVADTQTTPSTGRGGDGLMITEGSHAALTRVLLERNHEMSLLVALDSTLTGSHVTVLEPLASGRHASGVVASNGGHADLELFRIEGAPQCGAWVATGAELDLSSGEIASSDIGACVHAEGYDLERLTGGVRYRDNRVNIESVDFSPPEPEVSFEGL